MEVALQLPRLLQVHQSPETLFTRRGEGGVSQETSCFSSSRFSFSWCQNQQLHRFLLLLWKKCGYGPPTRAACTILRAFIVSILWQHEIGYRFNLSNFNFGRDWIFSFSFSFFHERAGQGVRGPGSKRPQRITRSVPRRSECAQQRAPVIHPHFPDGAQVEEERKRLREDGGDERGCSVRERCFPPKDRTPPPLPLRATAACSGSVWRSS